MGPGNLCSFPIILKKKRGGVIPSPYQFACLVHGAVPEMVVNKCLAMEWPRAIRSTGC